MSNNESAFCGFKFSNECLVALISLILTSKVSSDYLDFHESKSYKNLSDYLLEWFFLLIL